MYLGGGGEGFQVPGPDTRYQLGTWCLVSGKWFFKLCARASAVAAAGAFSRQKQAFLFFDAFPRQCLHLRGSHLFSEELSRIPRNAGL